MTIIQKYLEKHGFKHFEPKAALIDMDGTLYDSMPNHAAAWKRMADENGLDCTREEIFMHEGRTGASTINAFFMRQYGHGATDDDVKRLYGLKSKYFSEMPPVDAMPGAPELMAKLAEMGIVRVLVTGSGQNSLLNRLDTDFPGAFQPELRITAHNTKRGKPYPDPYLAAMALADVKPWQSIVIENAPLGVEAGDRSGAFTVAVSTGPIPKQVLADAGADIVYDRMEQCARELPQLIAYALTNKPQSL